MASQHSFQDGNEAGCSGCSFSNRTTVRLVYVSRLDKIIRCDKVCLRFRAGERLITRWQTAEHPGCDPELEGYQSLSVNLEQMARPTLNLDSPEDTTRTERDLLPVAPQKSASRAKRGR